MIRRFEEPPSRKWLLRYFNVMFESIKSTNDRIITPKVANGDMKLSGIGLQCVVINVMGLFTDDWWVCNTKDNSALQNINTLRPIQNGRRFADDIFKCIFLNENAWISLKISLKFVPKVQINNIRALVHIMAWRRPGDKPLSEPMMVRLLTHICVARPQWFKYITRIIHTDRVVLLLSDTYPR